MNKLEKFFRSDCKFTAGANTIDAIPVSRLPEIGFVGKSNVGKSSLINALVNQKIAITSKQPGRTKQLNFFNLQDKILLVDMPGYGYAKASKKEIENWEDLIFKYLRGRQNLKRLFLLIDSRRGVKDNDIEVMNILDEFGVNYQIVLTKSDEVKREDIAKVINNIKKIDKQHAALHPNIITTSSKNRFGMIDLMDEIVRFIKTKI
ncbi:ribosome biogenesis GTP-binding protein YihA/YsxC [Pseudomonadota bacterium]